MNVVVTLFVLVFLALWGGAVYGRLVRMRTRVTTAWAAKDREAYAKLAAAYNSALAGFPANIVAGMAGFKPAKPFDAQ